MEMPSLSWLLLTLKLSGRDIYKHGLTHGADDLLQTSLNCKSLTWCQSKLAWSSLDKAWLMNDLLGHSGVSLSSYTELLWSDDMPSLNDLRTLATLDGGESGLSKAKLTSWQHLDHSLLHF